MRLQPFQNLSPEIKAQLLHRFFPTEIPRLLNHMQGVAMRTIGEQELHYRAWSGPIAAFFLWVQVTKDVYDVVLDHHQKMTRNRRAFSRLLFTGVNLFFSQHALLHYTQHASCTNKRFKMAVLLLFS